MSAPPATQAMSLDIAKAYRCSPITPHHKPYIALSWNGKIIVDHCAPFGMTTAGLVQGVPADAAVDIYAYHNITSVKWVDDFDFLRYPISASTAENGEISYSYNIDLSTILGISRPLGIPWHDISEKGHDFSFITEYTGFVWDLQQKRVMISDKKRLKYLSKVNSLLTSPNKLSYSDVASIHGTLQHVTFVYRDGRAFLPALSHFAARFPDKWSRQIIPSSVCNDLYWWSRTLTLPSVSRSLLPRTPFPHDIWVDASTSWGIGLIIDGLWSAWKLRPGWKSEGRDIGWAESVAVELSTLWAAAQDVLDVNITIHGNNTSVIDAYKKGRSRNIPHNESIRRIMASLIPSNLTISPVHVPSEQNLADPISRGVLGSPESRLECPFELPSELEQFLEHV